MFHRLSRKYITLETPPRVCVPQSQSSFQYVHYTAAIQYCTRERERAADRAIGRNGRCSLSLFLPLTRSFFRILYIDSSSSSSAGENRLFLSSERRDESDLADAKNWFTREREREGEYRSCKCGQYRIPTSLYPLVSTANDPEDYCWAAVPKNLDGERDSLYILIHWAVKKVEVLYIARATLFANTSLRARDLFTLLKDVFISLGFLSLFFFSRGSAWLNLMQQQQQQPHGK